MIMLKKIVDHYWCMFRIVCMIYIYILATAYRPLLVWPLKTKATGTGNESTAGQPNDDSNVSARQRQGN